MNVRSITFIILGVGLGIFLFLKNPKSTDSVKLQSDKITIESAEDLHSPRLTEPKKTNAAVIPPIIDANSKDKSKANVLSPKLKEPKEKKDEVPFDPKKEVRYKVIEGYAIASEDIILGKPKDASQSLGQTTLISEEILLWPSTELHYAFDANLSETLKQRVLSALNQFAKKTSFKFIPYSGYEKDFLVFTASDKLCASYVGRTGGAQPILVNSNCRESEIMHELVHALGFIHEHQRDIRDLYVDIQFNNIQKDKIINFDILPLAFQNNYKNKNDTLDFKSLMLYPSTAFVNAPNQYSILIKRSESKITENLYLSDMDVEKINNLYFRKF